MERYQSCLFENSGNSVVVTAVAVVDLIAETETLAVGHEIVGNRCSVTCFFAVEIELLKHLVVESPGKLEEHCSAGAELGAVG